MAARASARPRAAVCRKKTQTAGARQRRAQSQTTHSSSAAADANLCVHVAGRATPRERESDSRAAPADGSSGGLVWMDGALRGAIQGNSNRTQYTGPAIQRRRPGAILGPVDDVRVRAGNGGWPRRAARWRLDAMRCDARRLFIIIIDAAAAMPCGQPARASQLGSAAPLRCPRCSRRVVCRRGPRLVVASAREQHRFSKLCQAQHQQGPR